MADWTAPQKVKGTITGINNTNRKDNYGNDGYEITVQLLDGTVFKGMKNYKNYPKNISVNQVIDFTFTSCSGMGQKGPWTLNKISSIDQEEILKEQFNNAPPPYSPPVQAPTTAPTQAPTQAPYSPPTPPQNKGSYDSTRVLHEAVEINRVAINGAIAINKTDTSIAKIDDVVRDYRVLKDEIMRNLSDDLNKIA